MKSQLVDIKLSKIVFDPVVYPRKDHNPVLVQRYVAVLEEIESRQHFICIGADNKLLDGKHRWLAYRKKYGTEDPTIKAFRYPVSTPHEQLKLAAELNSEHGWQLTEEDKEQTAKTMFGYGCTYDDIAATLHVGKKTVSEWLSRTVKEAKDRRDKRIVELWFACWTFEEIAKECGCSKQTINDIVCTEKFSKTFSDKPAAQHATDFEPPIYNVWKQQTKSDGSKHFGNSEVRWLDNLLYLYTKPLDIVVDPFAGGGSTIDVCRKRFRRYHVSDRLPIVEREKEIRQLDITDGLPDLKGRWGDVKLVYLDPPYWKQAEGQYSKDPTDLANMTLDEFNKTLASVINGFAKKLTDACIALIIQPTQWKAPDRAFIDHVGDMLRAVKLPVDMRFSVPYESQQCTSQMVEWTKEKKKCLVLTREIVVWKVTK